MLFEAAYAHTQLGIDLLRGAVGSTRAAVSSALAESALLTARLALFDLRRPAVAERCFDVALAATREADDHALAATVLGHMAFVPIFGARPRDADGAIRAALQHAWHGVSPVVRSWLHCVASEAEGRAGGQVSARHEIDLAAKAPDTDGAEMVPGWFDFYNSTRFESFAGYASIAAGDNADAAVHLQRALDGLGEADGKQRSVVLADLAQAQATDAENATDLLIQATDTLASDWYRTGFDRVLAVRPLLDGSAATILDERIEVLARANLSASSSF